MDSVTSQLVSEKMQAIGAQALQYIKKQNAEAELEIAHVKEQSVSVRLQKPEQFGSEETTCIQVNLFKAGRKAKVTVNSEDWVSIKAGLDQGLSLLQQGGVDLDRGLASAELHAEAVPNIPSHEAFSGQPSNLLELALDLEAAGFNVDPRIQNSQGTNVTYQESLLCYGNTRDRWLQHARSCWAKSCAFVASQDGVMEIQGEYSLACLKKDLSTHQAIARAAVDKAIHALGRRPIPTQKTNVLFAPECGSQYLQRILSALSGEAIYQRQSFLADQLGRALFPKSYHLIEQPHLPYTLSSLPFDREGVATRVNTLIENGAPTQYLCNAFTGRKLNHPINGHASGTTTCFFGSTATPLSLKSLLSELKEGLLVTEFMGEHCYLPTGEFSDAVAGFWVEQGEIAYPVAGVTLAGRLSDWASNVLAIGDDVDTRLPIRTGSIWVRDLQLAGSA